MTIKCPFLLLPQSISILAQAKEKLRIHNPLLNHTLMTIDARLGTHAMELHSVTADVQACHESNMAVGSVCEWLLSFG